jgi:hypothetical protein
MIVEPAGSFPVELGKSVSALPFHEHCRILDEFYQPSRIFIHILAQPVISVKISGIAEESEDDGYNTELHGVASGLLCGRDRYFRAKIDRV